MLDLNGKTILITGGCGFIGSNFIEYINNNYKNMTIVNIDKWGIGHRKLSNTLNFKTNNYSEVVINLCDLDASSNCFWNGELKKYDFEYVFHFAAESHVDRSIEGPEAFVYNNVIGITKLLELIRIKNNKCKIINVSTDEVFGHLKENEKAFTEISHLNPRSPYSASKASADLIAQSYVHTFDLDIVTTHCCNNFGPHQADEKLIPTIIRHLVNDELVPIYGNGKNIREWIYVDDHNKSILEIAKIGNKGWSYNIGSGVEKNNIQMVLDIAEILGKTFLYDTNTGECNLFKYITDRKGHDFRYAIESIRYHRKFELENHFEALKSTVEFYKKKYKK